MGGIINGGSIGCWSCNENCSRKKKIITRKAVQKKDVLEDLKDELDFNLYNIEEDEQNVIFYIKEDVFVNNIYNLLVSETKDIGLTGNDKEEFALLLENIKNMDSVEKVKNVVEEEGSYFLHIMSGFCLETISYISKKKVYCIC